MGGAPENKQFLISNKHLNSNVVYVLSKGIVFMEALWWAICSKNMDMMRANWAMILAATGCKTARCLWCILA